MNRVVKAAFRQTGNLARDAYEKSIGFLEKAGVAMENAYHRALALAVDWLERPIRSVYRGFKHFERVLTEGNYRYDKKSALGELLNSKMPDLPDTLPAVAASRMVRVVKTAGERIGWLFVLTLAAQNTMVWWGFGAVSVIGSGLMMREYTRARNRMSDMLRETNVAGQTVEGSRMDLCRLYNAQALIFKIADHFKDAPMQTMTEVINDIVASVADESKRVRVVEGGPYGAGTDRYEFSEIRIKLVNGEETSNLRQAWGERASNDNKLEERIRQLEAMVETMQKPQAGPGAPKP
jgi:hypothetical protein